MLQPTQGVLFTMNEGGYEQIPPIYIENDFANLSFGSVVKIKFAQDRHDTSAFPIALIVSEGINVVGGGKRYKGLFLNDLENPTELRVFNLYDTEIETVITINEARAAELFAKWYDQYGG
jgi:hypothetical protein